jgi:plasmid stability protein
VKNKNTRNITITLDEEVARWIRILAAEHDTSVSKLLGDFLKEKMEGERNYHQSMETFLTRTPKPLKKTGASYPSRDSLHER